MSWFTNITFISFPFNNCHLSCVSVINITPLHHKHFRYILIKNNLFIMTLISRSNIYVKVAKNF